MRRVRKETKSETERKRQRGLTEGKEQVSSCAVHPPRPRSTICVVLVIQQVRITQCSSFHLQWQLQQRLDSARYNYR